MAMKQGGIAPAAIAQHPYPTYQELQAEWPVVMDILNGRIAEPQDIHAVWVGLGFAASQVFPLGTVPMVSYAVPAGLKANINWGQILQILGPILISILQGIGSSGLGGAPVSGS